MKNPGLLMLLIASLVYGGCKLSDKQWDINMLVPIAHADLTMGNLLMDTFIKKYSDSSLYLVNVQPLKSLNIDNLLKIPDTSFQTTASLKSITLGQRTVRHIITLGQVDNTALGVKGIFLNAANGQKIIIPPIGATSLGSTALNAQSLFTSATFIGGTLELDIHNGFPIDMTHVYFQLQNKGDTASIIKDSISILKRDDTFTKNYPLAGKTLTGNLLLNIISISSPGSGTDSVLVDTTNAISIVITGSNMQVSSATAVFPAQNLIDDSADINYNLRGPLFTSFSIRSGNIDFKTTSTIKDTMHVGYSIPGAMKNGKSIDEKITVNPAGQSGTTVNDSFSLAGYSIDLTGRNKNLYNTFYKILTAHIDSTGKLESLSLADSIYVFYGLFRVIPEYAQGYLGKTTYVEGPDAVSIDFFKNMSVNKLNILNLSVDLHLINGIGAPSSATLRSITAFNSRTNQSIALKSSKFIGAPINIPAAPDTLHTSSVDLALNNTNSNIGDLLSILPDKLLYLFNFTVDPNRNSSGYKDFIYYGSTISASLNITLPLELGINGLTLEDTITPGITNNVDLTKIQDGTMHITVSNGYPLSARLQLYILDNTNKITDSLFSSSANTLPAGAGSPGNVIPGNGLINITLSQSQWQEIAAKKRLIMKVILNTSGDKVVKIYSNTHFKAKITGEFRYRNSVN